MRLALARAIPLTRAGGDGAPQMWREFGGVGVLGAGNWQSTRNTTSRSKCMCMCGQELQVTRLVLHLQKSEQPAERLPDATERDRNRLQKQTKSVLLNMYVAEACGTCQGQSAKRITAAIEGCETRQTAGMNETKASALFQVPLGLNPCQAVVCPWSCSLLPAATTFAHRGNKEGTRHRLVKTKGAQFSHCNLTRDENTVVQSLNLN